MAEPHNTEVAASTSSHVPALKLPSLSLSPTHRTNHSHITLPHLSPRGNQLFTSRRAIDTIARSNQLSARTSAEPVQQSTLHPPAAVVPPLGSSLSVPAVTAVNGEALSARSHSLLSAPQSHTARNNASVSDVGEAGSVQATHDRVQSISATTASVMAYIRALTSRPSASVSPRPITPDSPDSRPLTPASSADQSAGSSTQPQIDSYRSQVSKHSPQPHVYDISPSSTPRRHTITPSTRPTLPTHAPQQPPQPPSHRQSAAQQPPPLQQRIFSALDYDGNGYIGTQDLLRAVRAVKGRAAGGGGSGRGSSGSRSDEVLVECMLSMASMDDEEEVDSPSGQLSFGEFQRMIAALWPTALVSQ